MNRTLSKTFVESYCEKCSCFVDYVINWNDEEKYTILCKDYFTYCHVMIDMKDKVMKGEYDL